MSSWTYVTGIVEVDTFARSDAEAMYLAQTVINHLPRVTGSERNVEFHLSRPNRYYSSSSVDEFDQSSNLYDDPCYRMFDTQPRILIAVHGALRDRMFVQTLRETTKMLARLSSRLWVRDCLIRVTSGMGQSFIFDSPEWILDREITDWTSKLLWKFSKRKDDSDGG